MTADKCLPCAAGPAPAADAGGSAVWSAPERVLDSWATALAGPEPGAALRRRLVPLAGGMCDVLQAKATPPTARLLGAAFAAAGFGDPTALERTLLMLHRELAGNPRAGELIAALAGGYTGALRAGAATPHLADPVSAELGPAAVPRPVPRPALGHRRTPTLPAGPLPAATLPAGTLPAASTPAAPIPPPTAPAPPGQAPVRPAPFTAEDPTSSEPTVPTRRARRTGRGSAGPEPAGPQPDGQARDGRPREASPFGAVFSHAAAAIMIITVGGIVVEVNEAFCAMFGRGPEAFVGHDVYLFARLDEEVDAVEEVRELLAGKRDRVSVEHTYQHRDGSSVRVQASLSLVRAPTAEPRFVICLVEDVTERYDLQTRLRFHADHDPLTGLPTRAVLAERLQLALDDPDSAAVGVCAIDVDGFRGVNDTLGHDIGDDLLRAVAARLSDELVPEGHVVARAGGDEFVVLALGVDATGLSALAERTLAAIARPFVIGGHRVVVTATVGVVPGDGIGLADAGALLQAADTTLTRAKHHRRGGVAEFEPRQHRHAVGRFALAARMADALAAGEFSVDYQPLVRLADGVPTGVEALVRWDLPEGRRIGPDRFVPVAEETGLIVPLGRWVLIEACTRTQSWIARRGGRPLLLSVNLAARQVREPGIVDDIAAALAATGLPPHCLQVELTESDAMGGAASLTTLRAIAQMGVRIAIDDFGTGYSNFAYLRRLPVQTLKLAAPFVSGPGGDAVDVEISALLIGLAHSLRMTVVAEAIETARQCAQLRELGCDTGQGYFFAPPMTADTAAAWLTR